MFKLMKPAMLCALLLAPAQMAATPALAQDAVKPPAPATDSGVLRRIPLDEWLPESCPNPERQGEIIVCGRPDEEPTVEPEVADPGDRLTDVQSERAALIDHESAAPSTSCTAVGGGGEFGCSKREYDQWRRERALQKKRQKVPEPQ